MGPREQFYLSLEIEVNKLKPKKKENFVIDAVKYRDFPSAHPLPPVSNITLAPRSIEDVVLSFDVEPTTVESDIIIDSGATPVRYTPLTTPKRKLSPQPNPSLIQNQKERTFCRRQIGSK